MKASKSNVSRRLVLRGLGGLALGLPLMESVTQPLTAQAAQQPKFLIVLATPNGVRQAARGESETFWLRESGPLTSAGMAAEADRSLSVLSPYADDITVIKGINFKFHPTGNGAHHSNMSQMLTGSTVKVVGRRSHPTHMSIDRLIADSLNQPGIGPMNAIAAPADSHYLSFDEEGEIRSAQENPLRLFEQVVGSGQSAPGSTDALNARRKLVNDELRTQFQSLEQSAKLSSEDKTKLEAHRSLIQDIEVQLCSLEDESLKAELDQADGWFSQAARRMEAAELHLKVMTLAAACGHTYASTLQIGAQLGGGITLNVGGQQVGNNHKVSHRTEQGGDKDRETHRLIDILFFERLYLPLLGLLKERGLLDQGMAVWMNQSKDGMHGRDNVPHVIGGNAGGFIRNGLQVEVDAFNDHLLNTLINATGATKPDGSPYDDFGNKGDAPGVIEEIQA